VFLTGLGAIGAAPQPPAASADASIRPKVIVRRIVTRVVIVDPVAAPVTIPAPSSILDRAPGGTAPDPPPPASTTGGSHG